jgi:hypothetical protein
VLPSSIDYDMQKHYNEEEWIWLFSIERNDLDVIYTLASFASHRLYLELIFNSSLWSTDELQVQMVTDWVQQQIDSGRHIFSRTPLIRVRLNLASGPEQDAGS